MPRTEYPNLLQELIRQLRRMPGVGPRSAERIALWLVQSRDARPDEIADAILRSMKGIASCPQCGFFSESGLCTICSDPTRDPGILCVVEQPTDVLPLERTGAFRGLYFTLGGKLSPLDHIGPEDLRIDALIQRVKHDTPREIVFALGADVEGEATTNYLAEHLVQRGTKLTRIAQGLPAGLGLESADDLTITRALTGRTAVNMDQSSPRGIEP
jgi:recombination protein RecR